MQGEEEYINIDGVEAKKPSIFERFLESKYFWALIFLLVAVSSFALGRISKTESNKEPIKVISENNSPFKIEGVGGEVKGASVDVVTKSVTQDTASVFQPGTSVVGSKNGTKYHLPTCPGAKQISDKNKITFKSIEEARAKGYTPAANCKGLK